MFSSSEVRRRWRGGSARTYLKRERSSRGVGLLLKKGACCGKQGRDGDRSHTGVRRIKHWVKLDDEAARRLGEIVAIERAWGRPVHDEEVLAALIRVGYRMRSIEAHIPARSPRPRS
jgi:hypothetical protein